MAQNATEIVFTFLSRSSPAVLCREIRDPILTASEIPVLTPSWHLIHYPHKY